MANDAGNLQFGAFVLDRAAGRLLRAGHPVELKPKAFALLLALIEQPGKLLSKEELLDTVWGTRFITEGVIKTQIADLRLALGDDPKHPTWIETVHGRGYRFAVAGAASPVVSLSDETDAPERIVGRERELRLLGTCFERAKAGQRQLVAIAGDPGVGKSTLLERFVASIDGARVVSGQCVDGWGGNEPYLPVLNALDELCGSEPDLVQLLQDTAPLWLIHMPWHLPDRERPGLQAQVAGASPERMLREFAALCERLARERPLVWLLEDVHWADTASVHLLAAMARRRAPAAILFVLTFRPLDLTPSEHSFQDLRQELGLRGLLQEIPLDGLSEADLGHLVRGRHRSEQIPDEFVARLHSYTEGLPLFALSIVDELLQPGPARQCMTPEEPGLAPNSETRLSVPSKLSDMFDRQLQRLPADVGVLLEVAALAGEEFDHLSVADALGTAPDVVQDQLECLARRRVWLHAIGVSALPDGRVAMRCKFRHAVIRHVLAARAGSVTRIDRHRRLAAALQKNWGAGPDMSALLALHHEEGRQPMEAACHLATAARTALLRQAAREALMLAEKGLGLLAPMGPLAEAYRLGLISVRTTATILQDGMASTTARSLVADLLARLDTLPVSAATLSLWQVALLTHFTGRLDGTTELVEKFARLADQLPRHEGALGRAVAHNALGINALHFGRLADSADHFGRTIESLTGLEADVVLLRDPRAEAWSYLCLVAATLGRQQQEAAANREVDALIARGPDLITFGMGRWFQVYAHYFRSDAERAFVVASESVTLLESRRASPFLQPHRIGLGWAMAALGRKQEGAALAADGLKRYKEQGSKQGLAGLHAVVAETHRLAGLQDEMTQYVGDGLAAANQGGDGFATSELHRLHGHGEVAPAAADKAFRQALAAAQAQGASLMEARAALSLRDRLVMDGRKKEAAQLLQSMRARLSHLSDVPVVAALMSG